MTDMTNDAGSVDGAVTGAPRLLLRLEGVALGAAAIALYAWSGSSWLLFVVLLLAPDLSFLGFLAGRRAGAIAYNALHTTVGPFVLGAGGFAFTSPYTGHIALIWLAHIGIDRALGYGLKYSAGFGFTHLGRIGKTAAR
jgi:hypothetical protein